MKEKLSLIFLTLGLLGCDIFTQERTLTLAVPELPAPWTYLCGPVQLFLEDPTGSLPGRRILQGQEITLDWAKEKPGVFLVKARYRGESLKPGGGIFVPGQINPRVEISWALGWLAETLGTYIAAGGELGTLDLKDLKEIFLTQLDPGPWHLESPLLINALGRKIPGASDMEGRQFSAAVSFPPGLWISADPWAPVVWGPSLRFIDLPLGTSQWIAGDQKFYVWVDLSGWADTGVFPLAEP